MAINTANARRDIAETCDNNEIVRMTALAANDLLDEIDRLRFSGQACRKLALKIARERNELADAVRSCRAVLQHILTGPVVGSATIEAVKNILNSVNKAMETRDDIERSVGEQREWAASLTDEDRKELEDLPSVEEMMWGRKAGSDV